ncbi:NAD binding domain of 6-phosphogluconate dehydrogenase-domain-containing protein [Lipomyces starkeyi]
MVSTKPEIGFCGLGAMGGGMATHLIKCGFPVTGYDLYRPLVEKLVAAGGKAASSPAAAAKSAAFLILMVVNSVQADSVLFDPEVGAVPALPQGATIILCSTTPPQYLKDLRKQISKIAIRPDLRLLDCPVSGGSIRAANGTLSIFSSGSNTDLDNAHIVLAALADPLYRVPGGISMGSIAKMCHQHLAVTNIIMASEAMGLAAVAGLNTQAVYDAVMASKGASWMFGNRVPHMLKNDWLTVHSAVSIILKDAGIVTTHAKVSGFPLPLANAAEQLYVAGAFAGFTKLDDAAMVRLYLPAEDSDLVGALTKSDGSAEDGVSIETIVDILAGVHLASARECIAFAEHVDMDLELLRDIISKGAGGSAMFDYAVPQMLKAGCSLKAFKDAKLVRDRLEDALKKASGLRQALPMATTALQQYYFDLGH